MFTSVLEELTAKACPAIRYRLRKEVLGESPHTAAMQTVQTEILQDRHIRQVLVQIQDRLPFHGYNSLESALRFLLEKGLESNHPAVQSLVTSLTNASEAFLLSGIGAPGQILDEDNLGGSQLIRAALLSQAGLQHLSPVQARIERALQVFSSLSAVQSLDEVSEPYRGSRVFRSGKSWPSIYHLRLLAFSHHWRTPGPQAIIAAGMERLAALAPVPSIYARRGSQLIAPASFALQDLAPDIEKLQPYGWMQWFHRMELLARMNMVQPIPVFRAQVQALLAILAAGNGWFNLNMTHSSFKKWGAYTGLMLENDWRSANRRKYDLTFRSLLILHHTGCLQEIS